MFVIIYSTMTAQATMFYSRPTSRLFAEGGIPNCKAVIQNFIYNLIIRVYEYRAYQLCDIG